MEAAAFGKMFLKEFGFFKVVTASVAKASLGCCVDHLVRAQLRGTASAVNYPGQRKPTNCSSGFRMYQRVRSAESAVTHPAPVWRERASCTVPAVTLCVDIVGLRARNPWFIPSFFGMYWRSRGVTNLSQTEIVQWRRMCGQFQSPRQVHSLEFEFGPLKISVVRTEEQICGLSQRGR